MYIYNRYNNNCYTYMLDDYKREHFGGLNPGDKTEKTKLPGDKINLNDILELSLTNKRIKKPNILNKLGFGRRGYYTVYLVISEGFDYHWYRQDKGGLYSHKHGTGIVENKDGSGEYIKNPAKANHYYGMCKIKPNVFVPLNYNDGGIFLWVKRK